MSTAITRAIDALQSVNPKDLDEARVEDLLQLQYWCHRVLGPIAIKSLGRVLAQLERKGIRVGEGAAPLFVPIGDEVRYKLSTQEGELDGCPPRQEATAVQTGVCGSPQSLGG